MPPPAAQALSPSSRTASRIAGMPAALVVLALVAQRFNETLVRKHGEAHGH
jgi:hypothetical protein